METVFGKDGSATLGKDEYPKSLSSLAKKKRVFCCLPLFATQPKLPAHLSLPGPHQFSLYHLSFMATAQTATLANNELLKSSQKGKEIEKKIHKAFQA